MILFVMAPNPISRTVSIEAGGHGTVINGGQLPGWSAFHVSEIGKC